MGRFAGWRDRPAPVRWLARLGGVAAVVLLLYGVAWLVVPPVVTSQVQRLAGERLGREVRVGDVRFQPFTLELTLRDVVVAGAGGQGEAVNLKSAYANASVESLWRLAPVIDTVTIDGLHLTAARRADGSYDFGDILERLAQTPPSDPKAEPARFAVHNITLSNVSADFRDEPVGRTHTLRDLSLAVPFVSNLPAYREELVKPTLAFTLDGSRFDSSGQAALFVTDRQGVGQLKVEALDLTPYLGYLPPGLPVRLQGGTLGAEIEVAFEQSPRLSVKLSGRVGAKALKLADAAGREAVTLRSLDVAIDELRPLERVVKLRTVAIDAPRVRLARDAQGRLNLQGGAAAAGKGSAPTWDPLESTCRHASLSIL